MRPLVLPAEAPLLAVVHEPAPGVAGHGGILLVPPIGEEMNRCRLAVASAARRWAQRGWMTLVVDLYGTGDSAGDFGEATAARWCDDLRCAWQWLREQVRGERVLWAIRGGALLALSLRDELRAQRLVLWAPQFSGREAVDAVLRLATTAEAMAQRDGQGPVRERIRREGDLEIGGYRWSEALLSGLEALNPDAPALQGVDVLWLEPQGRGERLQMAGTRPQSIADAAFWRTAEPTAADAWSVATEAWLQRQAT